MEIPVRPEFETIPEANVGFKRAIELHKQNRFPDAERAYLDVLAIDRSHLGAWINLGALLRKRGQFKASVACSKRALELSPGKVETLTNLGNALSDLDRLEEALDLSSAAVQVSNHDGTCHKLHARVLRQLGKCNEALSHLTAADALISGDGFLHWERAVAHLQMGRLNQGWENFNSNWDLRMKPRPYDAPRWSGENIQGKTIVIHSGQSLGDAILFSRYIPIVKSGGARVLLECQEELRRLLGLISGVDATVEQDGPCESFDFYAPMATLPGIFRTDLNSIPPPPALHVPQSLPSEAKRLLDLGKNRFKVGVVWSGNVDFVENHKRAVSLKRFLRLGEIAGVQLYSLQKGPHEQDLMEFGARGLVFELGAHLRDFVDTAAVLRELDLTIMTDTSVAHLAGTLGYPVWNLLSYCPYWLYMMEREDCPWYPSMRLFRQPKPGDWDAVFANVVMELETAVSLKRSGAWQGAKP